LFGKVKMDSGVRQNDDLKEGRFRRETMGFPLFVHRAAAAGGLIAPMASSPRLVPRAADIDLLLGVLGVLVELRGHRIIVR
jgi:hypothetical protein